MRLIPSQCSSCWVCLLAAWVFSGLSFSCLSLPNSLGSWRVHAQSQVEDRTNHLLSNYSLLGSHNQHISLLESSSGASDLRVENSCSNKQMTYLFEKKLSTTDDINLYLGSSVKVKGEYERFSHPLTRVFGWMSVVCQALQQYYHIAFIP